MAKRARKLTEEVRDDILHRLTEGESLRSACRVHDLAASWFLEHIQGDAALTEQYARAKQAGIDAMAEEILDIADNGMNDWVTRTRNDGTEERVLDHEHVQRSRLRVDARKWLLAKMAPKKYGERILQEHSGPDGGALTVQVVSFKE